MSTIHFLFQVPDINAEVISLFGTLDCKAGVKVIDDEEKLVTL